MDLAISFDMTGSMTPCIYQVRCEINKLMEQLYSKINDLYIGIVTHGDYDSTNYVTQYMDFTNDEQKIKDYIMTIKDAGDNSFNNGEAYEEALRQAKNMSWREHTMKVLIVIGDDIPHEATSSINRNKIDWRVELQELINKNVKVYGVQSPTLSVSRSAPFYQELSKFTLEGAIIKMNQFSYIVNILLGLAFKDLNLVNFENNLIKDGEYNRNIEEIFNILMKREDQKKMVNHNLQKNIVKGNVVLGDVSKLVPVDPNRFQILTVLADTDIKNFVTQTGAVFKTGRGFYELSKREEVGPKKEVILQHKASGDLFTGVEARYLLKIPATSKCFINKFNVPNGYIGFIQSTSYNRKLIGGTKFLYEI